MRYRTLDKDGDYVLGAGKSATLQDTPEAVGQAVKTRLLLKTGEWFLDVTEGTPYATDILGTGTKPTYDAAIRERILDTEGVTELVAYQSLLDATTRGLVVTATISTRYGQQTIEQVL